MGCDNNNNCQSINKVYRSHRCIYFAFFQCNTSIEVLNLEGNAIDAEGAICLTKVLKENFFITELVSECVIEQIKLTFAF